MATDARTLVLCRQHVKMKLLQTLAHRSLIFPVEIPREMFNLRVMRIRMQTMFSYLTTTVGLLLLARAEGSLFKAPSDTLRIPFPQNLLA
jgi:hypothetical protein